MTKKTMTSTLILITFALLISEIGSVTIQSVTSTATTSKGTYDGLPAEYRSKTFTVTSEVQLQLTETASDINITIFLPGSSGTTQDCQYTVDGKAYDCNSVDDNYSPTPVPLTSITVTTGSNIDITGSPTTPVKTEINYVTKSVTLSKVKAVDVSDTTANNNKVTVSFTTQIDGGFAEDIVEFFVMAKNLGASKNATVMLRAVGPYLYGTSSSSPSSDIESGSVVDFSISLQHAPTSTQPAKSPQLTFSYTEPAGCPLVAGTLGYQQTGDASITLLTIAELSGSVTLSDLTIDDKVTFTGKRACVDDIRIGIDVGFTVTIRYTDEDSNNWISYGRRYIPTKPVRWAGGDQVSRLTSVFPVGGQSLTRRIALLPLGTLNDVKVNADLTSTNLAYIPVSTDQGKMTYSSSDNLEHSNPERQTLVPGDVGLTISKTWDELIEDDDEIAEYFEEFAQGISRKRRGLHHLSRQRRATQQLNAQFSYGKMVNPYQGGTSGTPVTLEVLMSVPANKPGGGSVSALTTVTYNGLTTTLDSVQNAVINRPNLAVTKSCIMVNDTVLPNIVRFRTEISHTSASTVAPAFDVALADGSDYFDVFFGDEYVGPVLGSSELVVTNDKLMVWTKPTVGYTETMTLSYKSTPTNNGADLPVGTSTYTAVVYWNASSGGNEKYGPISASCCITREDVVQESVFYQHGFTALGVIVGLIVGALIVILIIFLLWKCRRITPFGSVGPYTASESRYTGPSMNKAAQDASKGLVTDSKKGYKNLKDAFAEAANESLAAILALKDKFRQNRELENLDIASTVVVDMSLEEERNKAMTDSTVMLVSSLQANGDISKGVQEKTTGNFLKNLTKLEKEKDADYRKDLDNAFKKLAAKNKGKVQHLLTKQYLEKEDLKDKMAGMTEPEKKELLKLMDEQHETERSDLNYRLKLEQDEEAERLRKEYAIRWRMTLKAEQQKYLDDVKTQGKLSDEQIDWLLKEHYKNASAIEKLYDDEISRQRMTLEEKLARRRALAQQTELQDENQSEKLNTMAGHQVAAVNKAKKDGILSEEEAETMIEAVKAELMATKAKMDAERERQEQTLQQRLSDRKKAKMSELAKQQEAQIQELDKKHKNMQTEGLDPLSAVESRQTMLSHHRQQAAELENELDREHANELMELREQIVQTTYKDVDKSKAKVMEQLEKEGMDDDAIAKLLKKHDKDLATLMDQQEEDRQRQMETLKANLAKRQRGWNKARDDEASEQAALREHEDNVVRRLLDNQVAISDEEREAIMAQHKQHMVKLENSLTLNKLQQKRLLEEKLAKKRAQQLEKLEKKQAVEERKRIVAQKQAAEDSDSEEDEVGHRRQVEMMKKHARQKIDVIQGEKLTMEDELEEIRVDMMKERADALKEQEVRLAAMLAELQMAKAKELAKIESQQKAIHSLKSNLMDDLNERGMLSDPECQRVIEIHQQEQTKLNAKLENQRQKQEQAMKRRLEERLKQKEAQMSRMQQQEMSETLGALGNTPAAKIRRAALMHKHLMEVEKFRERMERELTQTLEEARRQNNLTRANCLQQQELQFLNGLVRLGKLELGEVETVVELLFPTRTAAERRALMDSLTDGYTPPDGRPTLSRRQSSLVQRVQSATYRIPPELPEPESTPTLKGRKKKKLGALKKRSSLPPIQPRMEDDEDYYEQKYDNYDDTLRSNDSRLRSFDNYRPDPIGRSQSPESFERGYQRVPPTRLPPMQPSTATKKKKKKMSQIQDSYSNLSYDDQDQDGF